MVKRAGRKAQAIELPAPNQLPVWLPNAMRQDYTISLNALLKQHSGERIIEFIICSRRYVAAFAAAGISRSSRRNVTLPDCSIPQAAEHHVDVLYKVLAMLEDGGMRGILGDHLSHLWTTDEGSKPGKSKGGRADRQTAIKLELEVLDEQKRIAASAPKKTIRFQ